MLIDFHREYPDILVKVQIENRAVDLVHREADIALRLGEPSQPDLIARRLLSVGFGLYASKKYLDNAPPVSSEADLPRHKMVALDTALARGVNFEMTFGNQNLPEGDYTYLTNSPAAQLSAVQAGFGIGAISHRWAMMSGELQRVLPDYTAAELDLWLVTHEELRHSARMRVIFDFIAERVLADKVLFETGAPD